MTTAAIGHNNPPDPMDEITAQFEAQRMEAEGWADGEPVTNEAQMAVVDALRKSMRDWRLALEKGQKDATAPLRKIYQDELDRWKPTIADAKRIEGCLVATVDVFKRKLAAEKAEAERKAREQAEAAAEALRKARAEADAANLEAQRAIEQAEREAEQARIQAAVAKKQAHVGGMVTKTFYEVTDATALLRWMWANDRAAVEAFAEDYARRNHGMGKPMDGVKVWQDKVAR